MQLFNRLGNFLLHLCLTSFFSFFQEGCQDGEEPNNDGQAPKDGADRADEKEG
jgi:hypothetical protein